MTLKKKMQSSSVMLVLLFLFVGTGLILEYQYLSRKAAITDQLDKQSVYLQMLLRGLNEVILNEGTPDSLNLTKKAMNGFDAIDKHIREKKKRLDSEKKQ